MRIYNPLSQQEEEKIDERFPEAADMPEKVPANNYPIDRIIFGVDSGTRLSSIMCMNGCFLSQTFIKKHYIMGVNTNMGS